MSSLVICSFLLCFITPKNVFHGLYFEIVRSLVWFGALFTVIVVKLCKGIDSKVEYDGQRAREIFTLS